MVKKSALAVLLVGAMAFCSFQLLDGATVSWGLQSPSPPFEEAMDASTTLQTEFAVRHTDLYAVELNYRFDRTSQAERDAAWSFAGGNATGASLHAEVEINKISDTKIRLLHETVQKPKLTSWGAGVLSSELAARRLTPGKYNLRVKLVGGPPPPGIGLTVSVSKAYRGK